MLYLIFFGALLTVLQFFFAYCIDSNKHSCGQMKLILGMFWTVFRDNQSGMLHIYNLWHYSFKAFLNYIYSNKSSMSLLKPFSVCFKKFSEIITRESCIKSIFGVVNCVNVI